MSDTRWRDEAIEAAKDFASIAVSGKDDAETGEKRKIRLRRGPGDLMHVLGYYFEQNGQRLQSLSMQRRLKNVAEAIGYIADHLESS